MAEILSVWSAYREQAHAVGDAIIKWARPEGWPAGPTSVYQKILHLCFQFIF